LGRPPGEDDIRTTRARGRPAGGDTSASETPDAPSVLDPVTGLGNPRALLRRLALEVATARLAHRELAVAVGDLDRFRDIRARHGPLTAENLLRRLGAITHDVLEADHFAGRSGNDEICLVLPGATAEQARALAQRIRDRLVVERIATTEGVIDQPSISFGVAVLSPADPGELHLLRRADRALVDAKARGPGRIGIDPRA
jgi:diguanylate cyclase (GGDEF)-like protein